ncbi:MAG: nucleotide-binding universal stress UspA family protein [Parvicellaceae bacterium]|jgi:nucleotide-binding universal stress UspA family protein
MHTILIPYDFSNSAKNAAKFALKLFSNRSTKFVFAHFIESEAGTKVTPEENDNHSTNEIKRHVDELTRIGDNPHHQFESMVLRESIVTGTVRVAEKYCAEAIFMGTKGNSDVVSKILGSITSGVIEASNIPVMAIPLNVSYDGFRRMVLGTDFRPVNDFDSYDYLMKLLSLSNSEFIVLNVLNKKEPATMEQTMSGITMDRELSQRPHRYDFVDDESTVHGLMQYVEKNKVDLLAMLKRDHYLINPSIAKSTVGNAVMEIKIPLLSLPDAK